MGSFHALNLHLSFWLVGSLHACTSVNLSLNLIFSTSSCPAVAESSSSYFSLNLSDHLCLVAIRGSGVDHLIELLFHIHVRIIYVHLKNDVFLIFFPSPLYQGNTLSLSPMSYCPYCFLTAYKRLWCLHFSWDVGFKKPWPILLTAWHIKRYLIFCETRWGQEDAFRHFKIDVSKDSLQYRLKTTKTKCNIAWKRQKLNAISPENNQNKMQYRLKTTKTKCNMA